MKIRQNLHIHSHHSCDSACATMADIQKEMTACGMSEFGISDHLHSRYNLCDIKSSRNDFLGSKKSNAFHFGIEVSGMSQWECEKIAAGDYEKLGDDPVYGLRFNHGPANSPVHLDITEKDIKDLGIEYVIGGVHWPLYSPPGRDNAYEDFFRQMMTMIESPLVDILAHPWNAIEYSAGGWFQDRSTGHIDYDAILNIPDELNEKLAAALVKYGKCAELNLSVLNSTKLPEECRKHYWMIFAQWREAGVKFTIGSDQHAAHANEIMFSASGLLMDCFGFKEEHIHFFFE